MKAIMEFNLPEEDFEHKVALNGSKYLRCLDALRKCFRDRYKYSEETRTTWDEVYALFWEQINDNEVDFDVV